MGRAVVAYMGTACCCYLETMVMLCLESVRGSCLLVMLTLCLLLAGCPPPGGGTLLGKAAPDFTLPDLAGNEVTLSALRGKPVLLDFGASWCGPCAMVAPDLEALHNEHAAEGLQVIQVMLDEQAEDVEAFVAEHRLTFPVLHGDPNSESVQRMAEAFELGAIPRTLLIDSKGVVKADMEGAHSREDLERALRKVGIGVEWND